MTLCLIVFLIYLFRVRKHLFKTQSERWLLAEKLKRREEKLVELASIRDQYAHQIEMQRSDAREKDMLLKDLEQKSKVYEGQIAELNKAKELLGTKSLIYKLSPILTFDAYKKILVCNGEIIPLNLQSSTLLLAFLNATDCQLTREEIEKCLSGRSRECLGRLSIVYLRYFKSILLFLLFSTTEIFFSCNCRKLRPCNAL